MSRLSDFYIGVLDFFGSLLPGMVTVGAAVALDVPAGFQHAIQGPVAAGATKLGAFVVLSYVTGQTASSIGSLVLDLSFDTLYSPERGLLSRQVPPKISSAPPRREAALPWWKVPVVLFAESFVERGARERTIQLSSSLDDLAEVPHGKGVYQRVRAYLKVAMPDAFADLEKLEADQKFFRALTVGLSALASFVAFSADGESPHHDLARPIGLLAVVLFVRYVSVRRKTVERAYTYFSFREHAKAERRRPAGAKD